MNHRRCPALILPHVQDSLNQLVDMVEAILFSQTRAFLWVGRMRLLQENVVTIQQNLTTTTRDQNTVDRSEMILGIDTGQHLEMTNIGVAIPAQDVMSKILTRKIRTMIEVILLMSVGPAVVATMIGLAGMANVLQTRDLGIDTMITMEFPADKAVWIFLRRCIIVNPL